METVTEQEFNAVLKDGIHISPCKVCGASPDIVVKYPWYGRTGAQLICPNCRAETKLQGITHGMLCDDGRIGSPVTSESMQRGINAAIDIWNQTCGRKKGGK